MEDLKRSEYLFEIKDLNLELFSQGSFIPILSSINFQLKKGESLALIGESGSGKSMTALSIMQLLPRYIDKKSSGKLTLNLKDFEVEIDLSGPDQLTSIRGKGIGMIFQDPNNSFNPIQRCGKQITEAVLQNALLKGQEAIIRSKDLIRLVGLEEVERMYSAYPHELSGGQLQRLLIAMALAGEPKILIADEATSNLDGKASLEINALLKQLQKEKQFALLYITHDLDEAKFMADRFILMESGQIVKEGKTNDESFLLKISEQKSIIKELGIREKKRIEKDLELLSVEDIHKSYAKKRLFQERQNIDVLNGVNLKIYKGQTIGIGGISGSGKSTMARIIMNLEAIDKGSIFFRGDRIDQANGKEKKELRKRIQMVYQNPFNTLNPRMSLISLVKESLSVQGLYDSGAQRTEAAREMLQNVGIEDNKHKHFTYQLSGGQRQRVAIARSLILQPELLILDESISALDNRTQFRILDLLFDLKDKYSLSYLFISHDQNTLNAICNVVYQLQDGKLYS